jgi:FtsP/CotA-like multicopper oxidase with cupredoxin domain
MSFVNETMWPHAMHLHGHHFFELDEAGTPGDFRDTTLVQPGQSRNVLFSAHNPGDWLLHCHMLGHHASGMGTWIKVI